MVYMSEIIAGETRKNISAYEEGDAIYCKNFKGFTGSFNKIKL